MSYMKYTVTLESAHNYSESGASNLQIEHALHDAISSITKIVTEDGGVSCGEDRLNSVGLVSVKRAPVPVHHFCPEPPKTWVEQIDAQLRQNEIDKLRIRQAIAQAQDDLRWIAKRDKALLKEYRIQVATAKRLKKIGIKSEAEQLNQSVHPDHQVKAEVRKPRKIVKK